MIFVLLEILAIYMLVIKDTCDRSRAYILAVLIGAIAFCFYNVPIAIILFFYLLFLVIGILVKPEVYNRLILVSSTGLFYIGILMFLDSFPIKQILIIFAILFSGIIKVGVDLIERR